MSSNASILHTASQFCRSRPLNAPVVPYRCQPRHAASLWVAAILVERLQALKARKHAQSSDCSSERPHRRAETSEHEREAHGH